MVTKKFLNLGAQIIMARKPRIHFKGAIYHVVLIGQDDATIFKSVADRKDWESLVAEGCQRFGHKVLAYSWMNKQANLVIRVGDAPLSRIMQNLSFRYTRAYNKRHGFEGPLFRGRYKAILIDPDAYLGELVSYVHSIPVRAGKAKNAVDFRWSSHAEYLNGKGPEWLDTEQALSHFGSTNRTAVTAFKKFVLAGKSAPELVELSRGNEGGRLLGDKKFLKKVLKPIHKKASTVSLAQIVRYVCQQEKIKEAELKTPSRSRRISRMRQLITCIAMDLEVASLTDMAKRYNRDLTTMSRNQRYFREKLAEDAPQQQKLKAYKNVLLNA